MPPVSGTSRSAQRATAPTTTVWPERLTRALLWVTCRSRFSAAERCQSHAYPLAGLSCRPTASPWTCVTEGEAVSAVSAWPMWHHWSYGPNTLPTDATYIVQLVDGLPTRAALGESCAARLHFTSRTSRRTPWQLA